MEPAQPDIQLIANVVVQDDSGKVLFVKYDSEDERWWLPGEDLTPYQHPDDRAKQVLDEIPGLTYDNLQMVFIESFRGRRGWHVMFNYHATGKGESVGPPQGEWFPPETLPQTMHGKWEREVIQRVFENQSD